MHEHQENPFQAPVAPLQDVASTAKKSLYRLTGVGIAAFIGGPLGGTWVITQNLKRIGQSRGQRGAWLIGISLSLLLLFLSGQLADNTFALPLNIATALVMHYCGKEYFGAALDNHATAGGSLHSNWRAAGVGLLAGIFLLMIWAGLFVLAGLLASHR